MNIFKYLLKIKLFLLFVFVTMCDDKNNVTIRPYSNYKQLKSTLLDSISNTGKLSIIDLDDEFNNVSIKKYNFIKRIGADMNHDSLIPIKSCSIIDDTTVSISSDKGIVRFIHSNTGALIKEFQQGWGPSEFVKPQKIINNEKFISIYDEERNFVNIIDKQYNHKLYIHIRNFSNTNTSWLYQQPAFGFVNDGLWIINDVDFDQPMIQHYLLSGELSESFPVPKLFDDAPAAFQKYGVWASETYLAIASIGIPYIMILEKQSRNIVKVIAINSFHVKDRVERILNKNSNIEDFRSIYELHFVGDRLVINFMSGLYEYELSVNNSWTFISKKQPTAEELNRGEILNELLIRTAEDSVYYQPTSHHFYGDLWMIVCPNARDYVDIFEYRETASQ